MIRAVCLNPVIDRTYHINGFQPGKKYFHLKPDLSVGGKGINVAKVCRLMWRRNGCLWIYSRE